MAHSPAGAAADFAWTARMVRPLADRGVGTPATFLAKTFKVAEIVGDETLRISAHGLYRCFINGKRVGDDLLTPGWTCYDFRLSYQTYLVAPYLRAGDNRIEIWLGDGWFRSPLLWGKIAIFNTWGEHVAAIAELRDGAESDARVLLATDDTWTSGALPILRSGIYFGEIFDARLPVEDTAGSAVVRFDTAVLVPHETAPVHELDPLPVRSSWQDENGATVYDFGQNAAGYVAISVRGEAGATIRVEHSEVLDRDGHMENSNYRTAEARLEYVLKGGGEEHYRPHFTFQGFRYARVTIDGQAEVTAIVFVPISSVGEPTASFTSGHPLVNRLVQNTLWSQRSNFIEVPTDCPQRDERLGWTGDAQVFAGTACSLFDSQAFFRKWLRDVMADQRPDGGIAHFVPDPTRLHPDTHPDFYGSTGWGDAICIVPWTLWLRYGDRDVLAETLPAMVKWVDFVWSISDGPIVSPPRGMGRVGFTFGDWLQPGGSTMKPLPTIGDEAAATIYLFIASDLTAKVARVLGQTGIAERMRARADTVRSAFAREFITASGRLAYDDQTSYALAILHDLVPEEHLGAARRYFKAAIARCQGRIGTGFIGTPALLPALLKIDEPELAAAVFLQEEVPGWLYQVKNGATTIWERWDSIKADGSIFEPEMNSYNHYAYGAVCQWLFEAVAGIRPDPDEPGFRHVLFEPAILPGLSPVKAHYDSVSGRIEAGWTATGDAVTYTVAVPDGARGTVILPRGSAEAALDGQAVAAADEGGISLEVDAGQHTISFRLARLTAAPQAASGLSTA